MSQSHEPLQMKDQPASARPVRSRSPWLFLGLAAGCVAIICLGIAVAGAFVFTSTQSKDCVPATSAQSSAVNPQRHVLFADDFSDTGVWSISSEPDQSIQYLDDGLNMKINLPKSLIISSPNIETYENVHLEVTVTNHNSDPQALFGLFCNQQQDTGALYAFAVAPYGIYSIVRMVPHEWTFLSKDWEISDQIAENRCSYRVAVDCGADGALTLYVDGQRILSVTDTTYTSGSVGLLSWTGSSVDHLDYTFDDFLVTELP